MNIKDKILKNVKVKGAASLDESELLGTIDFTPTQVYALNIALGGALDAGLTQGITMFAGESKSFKTMFSLICAKAYLDRYDDAVVLFYDNEFGAPQDYFASVGIPLDRVIHVPITSVEELKTELTTQLYELDKDPDENHIVIVVDSIGNMASLKETDDALEGKMVADMTRAKQLKSVFRIATPFLAKNKFPMLVVNHTYQSIGLFPKETPSGGRGGIYNANTIIMVTKSKETESATGTAPVGFKFTMNIYKSRTVEEGKKIPIVVNFDKGLDVYSGLLDIAKDLGYVAIPSKGWYSKVDTKTGEVTGKRYRQKETATKEFWSDILESKDFQEAVKHEYKISEGKLIQEDEIDKEME